MNGPRRIPGIVEGFKASPELPYAGMGRVMLNREGLDAGPKRGRQSLEGRRLISEVGIPPSGRNFDSEQHAGGRRRGHVGHVRVPTGLGVAQAPNRLPIDDDVRDLGDEAILDLGALGVAQAPQGNLF